MTHLGEPRLFTSAAATGAAYDHGAHVVAWTPAGHEPVLWLSALSALDDGAPIRGGVPICWPWFGPGRTRDLAPAHGFVRVAPWRFEGAEESAEGVVATWSLTNEVASAEPFPYDYRATYRAVFGAELELTLVVENTGSESFSYEEALHTYLSVGDIRQTTVTGLDGVAYLDKAPGGGPDLVTQEGDITFTGETDRVYESGEPVTVIDPVLGRRITITTGGAANRVVWNPWVAKAAAMPDFGDNEWTDMVCVEGANALGNAVVLAPGARHTLTYTVSVTPL